MVYGVWGQPMRRLLGVVLVACAVVVFHDTIENSHPIFTPGYRAAVLILAALLAGVGLWWTLGRRDSAVPR
jgi:hypothetical protein